MRSRVRRSAARVPGRPPRLPAWSVRTRIVAAITVVTALGLAVAGASVYLIQRDHLLADVDRELELRLESVRSALEGTAALDESASGRDAVTAPTFSSVADAVGYAVQHVPPDQHEGSVGIVDGDVRFVPSLSGVEDLGALPELMERLLAEHTSETAVMGTVATADAGALRYLVVPIRVDGLDGAGAYATAVHIDGELASLRETMGRFAAVSAAVVFVVFVVGILVAGRVLRPVRMLRDSASTIGATDLSERIPVRGRDDLADLTRTVNGMIARLDESFRARRQLLDDVRHELKTPLTIVRGHLELVDPGNRRDVEETVALGIEELDRMSSLVGDIAELADAELPALDVRSVHVGDLTRGVHRRMSGVEGREWRLGPVAEVDVAGDEWRLVQAWVQLADNASKYATPGTPVVLGSDEAGGEVRLFVRDEGPGIPAESRGRIFERFRRASEGRGVGGSGLGLSIVQAIAVAHGGRVSLDTIVGRGSTFAIVLPVGASARGGDRQDEQRKGEPDAGADR